MVDVWLHLDRTISGDDAKGIVALVAAELSRQVALELCQVHSDFARIGYVLPSDLRPDGRAVAERLIRVFGERDVRARLFAPPAVVRYIAPPSVQQRAAVEVAIEELTDERFESGEDDPLDEEQQRQRSALTEGIMGDVPWFEQDPAIVSEQFRADWWKARLAHEADLADERAEEEV